MRAFYFMAGQPGSMGRANTRCSRINLPDYLKNAAKSVAGKGKRGGVRPNAGRKSGVSNIAKQTLRELIGEGRVKKAIATIDRCLKSRDDRVALAASEYVINQVHGMPRQSSDVKFSGGMKILVDSI